MPKLFQNFVSENVSVGLLGCELSILTIKFVESLRLNSGKGGGIWPRFRYQLRYCLAKQPHDHDLIIILQGNAGRVMQTQKYHFSTYIAGDQHMQQNIRLSCFRKRTTGHKDPGLESNSQLA